MLVHLFEGYEKGARQEETPHSENEFGERKTSRGEWMVLVASKKRRQVTSLGPDQKERKVQRDCIAREGLWQRKKKSFAPEAQGYRPSA